jgi:hypothetical protein
VNYLDELAERIKANVPSDALPEGDTRPLFLHYAVLALAKGEQVTSRDVHNAWAAFMAQKGATHQSLVPFEELDSVTRDEDTPYVLAIREAARALPNA